MSSNRFDTILQSLAYINENPPAKEDRFWEVQKMINAWNKNMTDTFSTSWISCLDESMNKWIQRHTCPGFVFCRRKTWPFGNDHHAIACGESGILFFVEIVEGKEKAAHLQQEHSSLSSTIGLILICTKTLHNTGKVSVFDSGFSGLKGIIKFFNLPKYIPGEKIKNHFVDLNVGDIQCWHGKLDAVQFHLHCMKELDYIMSLMSTYGTMERFGKEKNCSWKEDGITKTAKFKYPEVVHNHYKYRHMLAEAYFSDTPQPSMLGLKK